MVLLLIVFCAVLLQLNLQVTAFYGIYFERCMMFMNILINAKFSSYSNFLIFYSRVRRTGQMGGRHASVNGVILKRGQVD